MGSNVFDSLMDKDIWPLKFITSETFLDFIDPIPEAVIISNEAGDIIQVNEFAQNLFSYSREEFLQLKIEHLVPESVRGHHVNLRAKFFANPRARFLGNRLMDLFAVTKHGNEFPMEAALFAIRSEGSLLAINIIRDLTTIKAKQKQLSDLAFYDNLTSLPNRHYFNEVFERSLAQTQRAKQQIALLFIDLDHFKPINDQQGHDVGDKLLQEIASRLKKLHRESDFLARFGGDEFTLLLPNISNQADAYTAARRILALCREPVTIDNNNYLVSASVGIAFSTMESIEKDLLQEADANMYEAKKQGGDTVCGPKAK